MKAILVDPFLGAVDFIELQKFEHCYELFDTDTIELVKSVWQGKSNREVVLCDENGLLKKYDGFMRGVGHSLLSLKEAHPIVGKFVIVGYDKLNDNLIDTELVPNIVGKLMTFYAWPISDLSNQTKKPKWNA